MEVIYHNTYSHHPRPSTQETTMESMEKHTDSLSSKHDTKNIFIYKHGDYNCEPVHMAVSSKHYRSIESLMQDVSSKMSGLPYGVRNLATPRGRHKVTTVDELVNAGKYICSSHTINHGMDIERIQNHQPWRHPKPQSVSRVFSSDDDPYLHHKSPSRSKAGSLYMRSSQMPKKVTVVLNGEPAVRHVMLYNKRTMQSFEQIIDDLSETFNMPIQRLYTIDGKRVRSVSSFLNGPDIFIVSGKTKFMPTNVNFIPFQLPSVLTSSTRHRRTNVHGVASNLRIRREYRQLTRGTWRVSIKTSDHPDAASDAQIMLTVYGSHGVSPTIPLGRPGQGHFGTGQTDEFHINVGRIGEIYKIRLSHDNIGDDPSWLCDEVKMIDEQTGERLVFPCKKWLSDRRELGETTRELPVVRKGMVPYPVLHYEVCVTVGDMWNGGSTADLFLTVYGERGDSGLRKFTNLYNLRKGQMQIMNFEAVSLGNLRKITIGHDGIGAGTGLFLEKIEIRELTYSNENFLFYSGQWLDEAEGDGKTFRDIPVCYEHYSTILERKLWNAEKWKYMTGNHVSLYNKATGHALRIHPGSRVDILGTDDDSRGLLQVKLKYSQVCVLSSVDQPRQYLALDKGHVTTKGSEMSHCEMRIHIKADRSVAIESVKYPNQYIAFLGSGLPAPVHISTDDLITTYSVVCKDVFLPGNVIMFYTSLYQTLSLCDNNAIHATGKRSPLAEFIISQAEVKDTRQQADKDGDRADDCAFRFESVMSPGRYLRMTDQVIDCQGEEDDELCKFLANTVTREGYVWLESATNQGLSAGITPDGHLRPTCTPDTPVMRLWPHVVHFANRSSNLSKDQRGLDNRETQNQRISKGPMQVVDQGVSPQDQGVSPQDQGVSPQDQGVSPQDQGVSPQDQGVSPQDQGVSPQDQGVSPQDQGVSPQDQGVSPQDQGVSPQDQGVSPQDQGVSPQDQGVSPQDQGVSPQDQGVSPQDQGVSPQDQGVSPQDQGVSPQDQGVSPQDQGVSPQDHGAIKDEGIFEESDVLMKITDLPRERTSTPKDEVISAPDTQWTLDLTADDQYVDEHPKVDAVLCGTTRDSDAVRLEPTKRVADTSNLRFTLMTHKIGTLKKLRLNLVDFPEKTSWKISNVKLMDAEARSLLVENRKDILQVTDMSDGVLEIPSAESHLPALNYHVFIILGDVPVNRPVPQMYLTMRGEHGTTGCRQLKSLQDSIYNQQIEKFRQNMHQMPDMWRKILHSLNLKKHAKSDKNDNTQIHLFTVPAVSIGDISNIEISHNQTAPGTGMFLKKVIVLNKMTCTEGYFANCYHWFDTAEADGLIARKYRMKPYTIDPLEFSPKHHNTKIDQQRVFAQDDRVIGHCLDYGAPVGNHGDVQMSNEESENMGSSEQELTPLHEMGDVDIDVAVGGGEIHDGKISETRIDMDNYMKELQQAKKEIEDNRSEILENKRLIENNKMNIEINRREIERNKSVTKEGTYVENTSEILEQKQKVDDIKREENDKNIVDSKGDLDGVKDDGNATEGDKSEIEGRDSEIDNTGMVTGRDEMAEVNHDEMVVNEIGTEGSETEIEGKKEGREDIDHEIKDDKAEEREKDLDDKNEINDHNEVGKENNTMEIKDREKEMSNSELGPMVFGAGKDG